MSSYLESVPSDVLELIAFFTCSSSIYKPPTDLLHLLLTSREIYDTLCPATCHALYARLFNLRFDPCKPCNTHDGSSTTSSLLALKFTERLQMLRGARLRDMSPGQLSKNLCIALEVVLEDSCINATQLTAVDFPEYLRMLCVAHLPASPAFSNYAHLLWLAALTWSRTYVSYQTEGTRDEILDLVRPYTLLLSPEETIMIRSLTFASPSLQSQTAHLRNPSIPAILLTFGIKACKEPEPLAVFPLSTDNVALEVPDAECALIGTGVNQFGSQVPLPLQLTGSSGLAAVTATVPGAVSHWRNLLGLPCCSFDVPTSALNASSQFERALSCLPGVWEGSYMIAPFALDVNNTVVQLEGDFVCETPLQCSIQIHPCPDGNPLTSPTGCLMPHAALKQAFGTPFPGEKLIGRHEFLEDSQVTDCILTGQTLPEHEEVWGGYQFYGKLTRDGKVMLWRTSKSADMGTWLFEGHLLPTMRIVGSWREISQDGGYIRGIFSLQKVSRE